MNKYGLRDKKLSENEVMLKKVTVNGNICGEFVEFSLTQEYENKTQNNIDAVYIFPIPDTAVLTGFEATLGGRSLKAVVEDKKDSDKIYEDALESGINALSIEQFEDNVFKISIGSILPSETVKINLSYMDQLIYEDNSYKLMIPTVVGPRELESTSDLEEKEPSYKFTMNLLVESFNKLDIYSPTHDILIHREEDTLCKVSLREGQLLDEDFVLIMKEVKSEEYNGMIYRYEVEEQEKAILYLRLFPKLEYEEVHPDQNYDFLIDISNSMKGDKMEEAKNAILLCLRNLEEGDTFNIIAFQEDVVVFSEQGKVDFNEENLIKATEWVEGLENRRGADIFKAIKCAMEEKNKEGNSTMLLFTDDMVENEEEILSYVKENIGDNRIFPFGIDTDVNSHFINKIAELGYGKPEFIYPGERIEDMVLRQFNRINNPEVDVLSIDWGAMEVERTYPRTIDYLYDREPMSIFAKVIGDVEGKVTIKGKVREEDYVKTIDLDKLDLEENADLIQKVWHRKRIESITERMMGERGPLKESMREKVVEISEESGIISRETTFVMLEQMDEPVLGMSINRLIPIDISEEVIKNIADGYFLDSPSFLYKVDIREKMIEEKLDKEKATIAMKYDRENLLRILAKNQFAEGAFANQGENNIYKKLESTVVSILAFTLGKEDINIYINQISKALRYINKNVSDNIDAFDERLTIMTMLALKSSMDRNVLRQPIKSNTETSIEKLNQRAEENKFMEIDYIECCQKHNNIKNSAAFMLGLNKEEGMKEDMIFIKKEKEAILDIAKLAIYKTL